MTMARRKQKLARLALVGEIGMALAASLLAASFMAASISCAQAADVREDAQVRAIIDKAVQAHGGAEKLSQFQAVSLDLHRSLGAFISLIVVNCLILGRAEAFASRHRVSRAVLDGLGMGLGFTLALLCMGAVRELLGAGALFGIPVLPESFQPWVVMLLPGGGFFTLGAWLLLINAGRARREAVAQAVEPA